MNRLIFQSDAVLGLSKLKDGMADLIVTDPPYESLEKHRAWGTTTRLKHSKKSSNDWFRIFPNARFDELAAQCYRVLKKNRHIYVWCDDETSDALKPALARAGFKVWKRLVWDKQVIGMGYHYRARYEFILFAEKGKRRLNNLAVPDVLSAKRIRGGYPTEKPQELYATLISQSTQEGELVVDPFVGSGAGGAAAIQLGRRFIGMDISADAVALARKRIEGAAVEAV